MIAGVFLRHYKIYQGANFIPIIEDSYPQTLFIGDNAVGKSSILEALNVYFTDSKWNLTRNTKRDQAFIAPLFLVRKDKITSELFKELHSKTNSKLTVKKFSENILLALENANKWYRSVSSELRKKYYTKEYRQLIDFIEKISIDERYDNHYLFMSSISFLHGKNDDILGERTITNTENIEISVDNSKDLLLFTKAYYTYVYFPVEENANEVLKLDSLNLQKLMNKNVLSAIESLLKEPTYYGNKGNDAKPLSLTNHLNATLDSFMSDINEVLKELNREYEFTHKENSPKQITEKHLIDIIVQRFLSVRSLKNNRKDISDLSSGEQRQSIINISLAFLKNSNNNKLGEVITAIDEPEVSLHMSKLYNQFELVSKMSNYSQLLITTHWYGYLPVLAKGSIQFIEKADDGIKIHSSISNEFYSKRNNDIKDDIYLKSYFDLSISIFSSLREGTNWIICEGLTDKKYIESYYKITGSKKDLRVLAVGGIGQIIRLYGHIHFPIADHKFESDYGKILFVTDTDENMPSIDRLDEVKDKNNQAKINLSLIRLCSKSKRGFVNYSSNIRRITEIENCLDAETLSASIIKSLRESTLQEHQVLSKKLVYNSSIVHNDSYSLELNNFLFEFGNLTQDDLTILKNLFRDTDIKIATAKNYLSHINPLKEIPVSFKSMFEQLDIYESNYMDKIQKESTIIASSSITIVKNNDINDSEALKEDYFVIAIREFLYKANENQIHLPEFWKLPRARTRSVFSRNGKHLNGTKYNSYIQFENNKENVYFNLDWSDNEKNKILLLLNERTMDWAK